MPVEAQLLHSWVRLLLVLEEGVGDADYHLEQVVVMGASE